MSSRIQAYMRESASRDREVVRIGPFTATFSRHSSNPFLNYAIPDEAAEPTAADAAALVEAYQGRGLLPRLEYLPGLAPAVEPALLAAGFTVEDRLPLMQCPPGSVIDQAIPTGFALAEPETDDDFRALLTSQHEAFGEGPPTDDDVASSQRLVAAGGLACLARDTTTGDPAGGGACTALRDGMAEVAGIGVREKYRRHGLGGVITLHLTRAAHQAGADTVFLTPAGDPQERVYARVGYYRIDSVLFLSRRAS